MVYDKYKMSSMGDSEVYVSDSQLVIVFRNKNFENEIWDIETDTSDIGT